MHDRALNTCVICPTDGRDVTGRCRNRPGSIKARAVEPASAFCHSATATLCVSVDLCCESYLVAVCLSQALRISSTMAISAVILALGREQIALQAMCSSCKRIFSAGDTHSLCVVCLRAEQAESALEGAAPAFAEKRRRGDCARGNRR